MNRSRIVYGLFALAVIILGLTSRTKSIQPHLPNLISEYAGDTLYALMAFFGFAFLWHKTSTLKIAGLALGFCIAIELSQLYHAPWIDAMRRTRMGGLILGFGFLWSDLVCYLFGVLCGIAFELLLGLVKVRKSA